MGTKPTSVSISGYNTAPPVDDGTISESNKVKWSGIKTKLADPVKTAVESINTGITGAIGTVIARSSNTQIGASNYDDCFVCTSTFSQTFVGASTLTAGWRCYIVNNGTGTITLTPNGAETINGASILKLFEKEQCTVYCDGSNLFAQKGGLVDRLQNANGYVKLTGGIIIQWGASNASVAGTAVTFPVAFPSAVYGVYPGTGAGGHVVSVSDVTTSGFTFYDDTGTATHFYFAIGV